MTQAIVLYLPVLHQGYINFFQGHAKDAYRCLILDRTTLPALDHLRRDMRALTATEAMAALAGWQTVSVQQGKMPRLFPLSVGAPTTLEYLGFCHRQSQNPIVMPEEDISHSIARQFFDGCQVIYDSTFLRWDMGRSQAEMAIETATTVTNDEAARRFMHIAETEAVRSADWWRQVGAVVVKDDDILLRAFNHHMPDELQPYYDGDPRADFDRGICIELSTAIHAEAALVAEAARLGIFSLADTDLFVSVFPCPPCARLIAAVGFKRLYFGGGYSILDGQEFLRSQGIEIIRVLMPRQNPR